jgi:hypothetical protein
MAEPLLKVPAAQVTAAAGLLHCEPAGQGVHELAAAAEKWPTGHGSGGASAFGQ